MSKMCVYRWKNIINGKNYIGVTKNFNNRSKDHIRSSKKPIQIFHKALSKYGESNFIRGVLIDNIPEHLIDYFEQYWIDFYKSYEDGYNMNKGGFDRTHNKNIINVLNKETGRKERITKDEFYSNKNKYTRLGGIKPGSEGTTKGLVSAMDIQTGKTLSISKEEFEKNPNLVGVNKSKVKGKNNGRAKNIIIVDNKDVVRYFCQGNIKSIIKENNLPSALLTSYRNNGERIYLNPGPNKKRLKKSGKLKYKGWYAVELKNYTNKDVLDGWDDL